MAIADLLPSDERLIDELSRILLVSFAKLWPAYLPTLEAARETVMESFGDEHLSRVWLTDDGRWDPLESTCRHASLSIL